VAEAIDNACRHTPAHSPIHVTLTDGGNTFIVRVADHGAGLSEAARHAAASTPAAPASRPVNGAGLGLYLSRRLTQLLGGGWELSSEHNVGTQVVFTFPVAEAKHAQS
ncbi:MAG TPA: ATP-binding protein, partial [Candidatus Synoicihabitans sp.]|nr:ATP-binding protein [Candidatus Synoicihabitans sp.]